jgi:hypothetical protein
VRKRLGGLGYGRMLQLYSFYVLRTVPVAHVGDSTAFVSIYVGHAYYVMLMMLTTYIYCGYPWTVV